MDDDNVGVFVQQAPSYIEFIVNAIASDAIGLGFIVGAVIFLLGLIFLSFYVCSRATGYRTTGTVVGAIESVRIKKRERDGEVVEKEKRSLYPVYEYAVADGTRRQMQGSEGGTMVHSYTTGQSVNLIVREDETYDDVYDADQHGAVYTGLTFAAIGAGIMVWVGSMASAFGVTVLACVLGGLLRIALGLLGKKRSPQTKDERKPYSKSFDPSELKPIESFSAN